MTRWERLADRLRDDIRAGRLRPGDLLPSYRLLGEEHGVSYATVRQALTVLRMEGWVIGEPGVGVRVRGVSDDPPPGRRTHRRE